MKIGFLINPNCAISGMSNGILKQAAMWAEGLRGLGHEVDFIGPRQNGSIRALKEFDVVHFFQHGHWLKGFLDGARGQQKWFFSPILDSTASPTFYGILAKVPLEHYLVSFGPRLLRGFSMRTTVSVRSSHERAYLEVIAPDAKIVDNPIAVPLTEGDVCVPKHDLPEKFALFIGNVAAERKNVLRLIEACDSIGLPLVLGGALVESASLTAIQSRIGNAKIAVHCLGFLLEEELRWLYRNCSVFCLPSLVEGVGQVAMEALYFGAPVVITSVGGPPDYFGDHAEYVNPYSVESIVSAIGRAMGRSVDLAEVRRSLEKFSIENTTRGLADAYSQD
ncbi:glycosyltransferase family 4 protein [Akkermansiaceae bacterium]|nr:glycosyltransferase family 4 protein [Akkermansiaceae bacterium]MDB4423423.1 glycosyltransferase family 4 protein [bacterium]